MVVGPLAKRSAGGPSQPGLTSTADSWTGSGERDEEAIPLASQLRVRIAAG